MIDIHCHLLPAVDDGARTVGEAVEVLRQFRNAGVTTVILTPHLRASDIDGDGDAALVRRAGALAELEAAAPSIPRLEVGFEIMLDQTLPARAISDRRFALGASRYYLVEFHPTVVGAFAVPILRRIADGGAIPIVAHPERYVACAPDVIRSWRDAGARVQVDATTLTRKTTRAQRARALLSAGLVDVVAADNHGDTRSMDTAVRYLRTRWASDQITQVTTLNPAAILEDRPMHDGRPAPIDTGWMRRLLRIAGL